MPHFLTLPREIRDRIYDFYLQGLALRIKPTTQPYPRDSEALEWQLKFKQEGLPNILSLRLVNHQIAAELRPIVPSKTKRLILQGQDFDDYAEPVAKIPREYLQSMLSLEVLSNMGGSIEPQYSEVIRALPNLRHVTWRYWNLALEEFLPELPEHSADWENNTVSSIVDLVKIPANFDHLRQELEKRFRTFWESDQPSFFAREFSVAICQVIDTGMCLWVCARA